MAITLGQLLLELCAGVAIPVLLVWYARNQRIKKNKKTEDLK